MKKILFAAYTLDVGGIETALVNLLNYLITRYEVTLVLEKKQGIFLRELNPEIKIIEYAPSQSKNTLERKIINLLKRIKFIIKHKSRYDFAASFATYSKMGSFCARTASTNSALWVHTDYLYFYENNSSEMINFLKFIKYDKFKKIICVSNAAKQSMIKVLPETKNKILVIHNLIDGERVIQKSQEKVNLNKEDIVTFLNVSRHDEKSKRITRIINVAEKLKKDDLKFKIILIGQGKDTDLYKIKVGKKKLDEQIVFLGEIKNPYPYFKISDALLLTSEFEGYPVIFDEARVLNLPIITTNVSDSELDINGICGMVTRKDEQDIYSNMKSFILQGGYIIKENFDYKKVNDESLDKLEAIIKKKNI